MGWLDDIIAKAQDKAGEAYAEQPGYQDQGDAMRHILVTGQLAQKVGRYPALGLMAAHELVGGEYSKAGREDSAMDLSNNRIGAELGASTGTFGELLAKAKEKVDGARLQKKSLADAVMSGDPRTMSPAILKRPAVDQNRYTSKLNTAQETEYQLQWKPQNAPRDSGGDYDLRGAYIADKQGRLGKRAANGHLTDEFKKPNHPTFSTGSRYHGQANNEGGVWGKDKDGKDTFTPGRTNMQQYSRKELEQYFREREPNAKLIWPSQN